jgi:hypothetical protein
VRSGQGKAAVVLTDDLRLKRALQVRVTQTIRSQESSITLFNIAHLLQFYSLTMRRTIGEHSPLTKTLQA